MQRVLLLKELVRDSRYVVDEQLVAAAIIARALMRMTSADTSLRSDLLWG